VKKITRSRSVRVFGAAVVALVALPIVSASPAAATANPVTTAAPVKLAAGDRHTCAVAGGRAYCWGRNDTGNLGDGTTTNRLFAVPVKADGVLSGKTLVDISAAGHGYTCVLDSSGKPYCWGENEHSQLGDGTTTNATEPLAVTLGVLSGKHVRRIVDQYDHTCVLDSVGQAYCWGHQEHGGLGNGATADANITTPTAVTQSVAFTDIQLGQHIGCAIGTNHRAYCWGDNDAGGVGDASNTDRSTPVAVDTTGPLSGKTVVAITAGTDKSCALDSAGAAYCWGDNSDGALGDGSTTNTNVPVHATGILSTKDLVRIETDDHHTCALDSTGAAYCWGLNDQGQLGDGSTTTSNTAVAVDMSGLPTGTKFADIRLGYRHTCAQTANGRTYCWGGNDRGQLGDGSTTSRSRPVEVNNLPVLPSAPTGVTAHRSGTSVLLSWTAPADPGSPALIGYVVMAMPGHHTCETVTTSCRIDGLSMSTTYTFTVTASSVLGDAGISSVSLGRRSDANLLPETGGPAGPLALAGLVLLVLGGVARFAGRGARSSAF
jgi:alpha-tubulin suppressor-like RCC1 family protein